MSITIGQRPGVYSSYQASTVRPGRAGGAVGFIACVPKGEKNKLYQFGSVAEVLAVLGEENSTHNTVKMCGLALLNGASRVYIASTAVAGATPSTSDTKNAFKNMENCDVDVVGCDQIDLITISELKAHILAGATTRRERMGVVVYSSNNFVTDFKPVENEYLAAFVVPKLAINGTSPVGNVYNISLLMAGIAGMIAGRTDPSAPLTGAKVAGFNFLNELHPDADVDQLVGTGYSPLEMVDGSPTIVRAVTTRTKTNGVTDNTWRELTTIRTINYVMKTLRNMLGARFLSSKNLPETHEAVRTQTVVELEKLKAAGIIAGYGAAEATQNASDPARCDVSFEFAVSHGMNTIVISADVVI